jgi:methylenetetrahydrofolate dehydrogenase (NADP+) / methenyltetrahydrofolate cyclohydrolase
MIIDGRALAREVLARTRARVSRAGRGTPKILVIVANETPATKSYLAIKSKRATDAGCVLEVMQFSTDTSTAALHAAVLSASADAIIVQLPLPSGVDTKAVCDAIPLEKDADVLSDIARAKFEMGDADALLPPVVGAVQNILAFGNVEIAGKPPFAKGYGGAMKAVVIGDGWLVGKPVATWFKQQGAEVTVLTVETEQKEFTAALRAANIIISGAGSPHLIKPNMLKEGIVLIDAGTSESGGEVVGDADPACAAKCSLFTTVPGGVGPLAVAYLFDNAVTLAERKK